MYEINKIYTAPYAYNVIATITVFCVNSAHLTQQRKFKAVTLNQSLMGGNEKEIYDILNKVLNIARIFIIIIRHFD